MANIQIFASDSSTNSYIVDDIIVECGYSLSTVRKKHNGSPLSGFVLSHNHIDHARYLHQYEKAETIGIKNLSDKYLYSIEKHGTIDCKTFWFKESSVFFLSDCSQITKKPPQANIYMIECNHDLEYIDDMNLWNVYHSRNSKNHLSLQSLIKYIEADYFNREAEFIFLHCSKVLFNIEIAEKKLNKFIKKFNFASRMINK